MQHQTRQPVPSGVTRIGVIVHDKAAGGMSAPIPHRVWKIEVDVVTEYDVGSLTDQNLTDAAQSHETIEEIE
jgi:hypothetical protein